ncbi:MAG: hypothetical protein HUJ68_10500 [Clostridia bacterium]|nr:hypothetical protein [Clostridia bacterium]
MTKESKRFKKINTRILNSEVKAQSCSDDCIEKDVWVGKTNGNVKGCVLYSTVHTPRTTTWW